jgi:6-phosphogluconolactonase
MKTTRRKFLCAALSVLALGFVCVSAPAKSSASGQRLVYVGTYTEKTQSKGIYAFHFDPANGQLTEIGLAAETTNPSFLAVSPNGNFLYAVNEAPITDGGEHGAVTAFSIDAQSGKLTELNQVSSLGVDPCFITFDRTGGYILVANYTRGSIAVFPLLDDGRIGKATAFLVNQGTPGPNKARQEGPHAHNIYVSKDNRFVFVVDLGLDEVLAYRFDASNGTLTPNKPAYVKIKPGSGPRHIAFTSNEKFAYVLSEMGSIVTSLRFDAKKGSFKEFQVNSSLPPDFHGENTAAEIAIHPNGKFLYASNRGNDSIAIFGIDPRKGTLTPLGGMPSGGKNPRHFAIDPSGNYLLAENEDSNDISVFRIDTATGALSNSAESVKTAAPVCLVFVPMK